MELGGPQRTPLDGGGHRAAVVTGGDHFLGRSAGEGMDEIDPRSFTQTRPTTGSG